jgi:hypothetical protein
VTQRDYYTWSALLRDGSTITEQTSEGKRSLYRPLLDVACLTLEPKDPAFIRTSVTIPEGAFPIFFKLCRGVQGFEPNSRYPGLFYLVSSPSVQKQIAEKRRSLEGQPDATEQLEAYCEKLASGTVADQILRQASVGMTATLDELLAIDAYCIGYDLNGKRSVQWIVPTGETEVTDGSELTINENFGFDVGKRDLIERVYRQSVEAYIPRILDNIRLAKEEIASFEAVLSAL